MDNFDLDFGSFEGAIMQGEEKDVSMSFGHSRYRRSAGFERHVDLFLSRVELNDEAGYECVVKPLGAPSMSATLKLQVQGKIYTCTQFPLYMDKNVSRANTNRTIKGGV